MNVNQLRHLRRFWEAVTEGAEAHDQAQREARCRWGTLHRWARDRDEAGRETRRARHEGIYYVVEQLPSGFYVSRAGKRPDVSGTILSASDTNVEAAMARCERAALCP